MKKLAGGPPRQRAGGPFLRQGDGDLVDWIGRRFPALGHDIDTADAQYLIFLCGDLMHGLIGEIEKIGAYAQGRRVTRQDIDAVAIPVIDAVVFQMTGRPLPPSRRTRPFPSSPTCFACSRPPIMILAVLGKHFRQLYTARVALESGKGSRWVMELWGCAPPTPPTNSRRGPATTTWPGAKPPCAGARRPTWP